MSPSLPLLDEEEEKNSSKYLDFGQPLSGKCPNLYLGDKHWAWQKWYNYNVLPPMLHCINFSCFKDYPKNACYGLG